MSIQETKNKIASCREAALAVLKPSKRELEHGLELHKNSLVWEAYGFAPIGFYRQGHIEEIIGQGASLIEVMEAREEMLSLGILEDSEGMKAYRLAWEASGVNCIFMSAGESSNRVADIIRRFARFTHLVDQLPDFYQRATTPEDIESAWKKQLRSLYLTVNGIPVDDRETSVEEMLLYIKTFFQLGCRMMHLTYNRRNMFGDGCGEATDAGLSDLGVQAIKEMNHVGVIVDLAHSGSRTTLEAAEASEKPIVASHSGCYAVNPHCRNKTDEAIAAVAKGGGAVGIAAMAKFLGRAENITAMLDHIDHIAENFGIDHVMIGTDKAFYTSDGTPRMSIKSRQPFSWLWPPNSTDPVRRDEYKDTMAWTNWPMFTVGMVQRGYSDEDVRKVIGGNIMRIAKQALSEKTFAGIAQHPGR